MTRYTEEIRIRVSPENKAAIQAAADRASLDMSSWARMVLVRAANVVESDYANIGESLKASMQKPPTIHIDWSMVTNVDLATQTLVEKIVARPMEIHRWKPHREAGLVKPDCNIYVAHQRGWLLAVCIDFLRNTGGSGTTPIFTELASYSNTTDLYNWIRKRVPGAMETRFPENAREIS